MSRNLRQKQPQTPRKAARRRGSDSSSSLNLSDDDGYSGVEDVSDSEDDDEEDVDAAEEEHIIIDEVHTLPPKPRSPRSQSDEDDEDDDEDEDGEDDDDDDNDEKQGHAGIDDSASWDGIMSEVDESSPSDHYAVQRTAPPPERHVRFDVPSSDSDSTETEDDHADFFPDIFVEQSSLDPAFRRELELDADNDDSSNSGSFWDYHGGYGGDNEDDGVYPAAVIQELEDDETPVQTPVASQVSNAGLTITEVQELDGYETDGDTTEEDIPEPLIKRRIRRSEPRDESSESDTDQPSKFRRGQPRVGRFNLDSSERKPIAVVNPISRKMMIFTTHRRRQLDLSPEQFNLRCLAPLEEQSSPMLSNSAQIMMSAMFSSNTFGDYLNTQPIGPAEAFFPFPSDAATADESSDLGGFDEEEDGAEKHLDISDFITWDDGCSSADDEDDENDWTEGDDLMSTPARASTVGLESDVHSHINADTVGAFRRDQINQRLILSSKATQDSLALSSPYNYTTLRGLKSDRFETAAVPLTPLRRQKKKQVQDLLRSPLETVSQKRKASAELALGHKRQRSISDVNLLRI